MLHSYANGLLYIMRPHESSGACVFFRLRPEEGLQEALLGKRARPVRQLSSRIYNNVCSPLFSLREYRRLDSAAKLRSQTSKSVCLVIRSLISPQNSIVLVKTQDPGCLHTPAYIPLLGCLSATLPDLQIKSGQRVYR